jgi:Fe-S oxidoreductase
MRKIYPGFDSRYAPRITIARLLLSNALNPALKLTDLLEDDGLWMCLTCEACVEVCPQEVQFRDFVEHLREVALELGLHERFARCSRCGKPYLPKVVVEALGKYLPDEESRELLLTCPRCRRRAYSRRLFPLTALRPETRFTSSFS